MKLLRKILFPIVPVFQGVTWLRNYFYDNDYYFNFLDRCHKVGIEVPIIPGIMPVYSIKMLEMLAGLCGATITAGLQEAITSLPEGDKVDNPNNICLDAAI